MAPGLLAPSGRAYKPRMTEARADRSFPVFSEHAWRNLVRESTGGKSVEDFAFRTEDEILRLPLYGQTAAPRLLRRQSPAWTIVQRIDHGEIADAARQIADDLAGGADGIDLVFAGSPVAHGRGLPGAPAAADLISALPGNVAVRLDGGEATLTLAAPAVGSRPLALAADVPTILGAQGFLRRSIASHEAEILAFAAALEKADASGVLVADGRVWHAGGASEGQELAAVLAGFTAILRLLVERGGLPPVRAAGRLGICLSVDADRLAGVAKLRAARLLLRRVLEVAGISGVTPPIHAESSWRMLSRRDIHVNVLRSTAAALAAIVGGADSLTVLPHTLAAEEPDPHARRLARNLQAILLHEARLHRVADPGSGSGAVESLTGALAETAWEKFRAIEAAGGILAAVLSGSLQAGIAATRDARARRLRDGKTQLVGTTLFPAEPAAAASFSAAVPPAASAVTAPPLVFARLAGPYESEAGQLDAGGQRGRNDRVAVEDSPPMLEAG